MGGFERFCWAVTALASIAAAALLGSAYFGHGLGVPQETAFAAVAVAVIPYVFTRAIQAMGRGMRQEAPEDAPAAEAPAAGPERRIMPVPSMPTPELQAEPEPSWAEPPRPKRDGMGRVFWFLVGILVILLLVAAFLVLKGP